MLRERENGICWLFPVGSSAFSPECSMHAVHAMVAWRRRRCEKDISFPSHIKSHLHLSADGLSSRTTMCAANHFVLPHRQRSLYNRRVHKLSAKMAKLESFVGLVSFLSVVSCVFQQRKWKFAVIQKYCTVAHRHFTIAAEYCLWRIRRAGAAVDRAHSSFLFDYFILAMLPHRAPSLHSILH